MIYGNWLFHGDEALYIVIEFIVAGRISIESKIKLISKFERIFTSED